MNEIMMFASIGVLLGVILAFAIPIVTNYLYDVSSRREERRNAELDDLGMGVKPGRPKDDGEPFDVSHIVRGDYGEYHQRIDEAVDDLLSYGEATDDLIQPPGQPLCKGAVAEAWKKAKREAAQDE